MDSPLKTFTAGFRDGEGFDDTGFAALSAEFFGTQHFETFPTHLDFERDFTNLIRHLDEPVAAPGAFAQYAVARLAAPHVKVVLGGQGADELIGGYARYYLAAVTAAVKAEARGVSLSGLPLANLLENLGQLEAYRPMIAEVWPHGISDSPADLYLRLIRRCDHVRRALHSDVWSGLSGYRAEHRYREVFCECEGLDVLNRILHYETIASLPALLQVEDRVSMAWSLEARVPFLDVRIAELIFSLPVSVKFKDGRLKSVLRAAMKDVVPAQILGRSKKVGFPVPLKTWLDGPLRDWVRDLLLGERTRQRGLFSQDEVCRMLDREGAFGRGVWGLLCLETWFRLWVDGEGLTAPAPRHLVPEVGAA
jgi:asparagine synthase (glutamine-hydrolysing)